ncbi:hypothetical protein J3456_11970 [Sulfitobacter sp. NFXS29]|uniref:hypothetical protein n=1 Tax=Sulfitobacter sp. NFXS29 TaxID=2818438 RepID=UPI0032DFA929
MYDWFELTDAELSETYGVPLHILQATTTPEAKRLVVLGSLQDRLAQIELRLKRKAGRPAHDDELMSVDAVRAMCCWDMAHVVGAIVAKKKGRSYSRKDGTSISNREVIGLVDLVEQGPYLSQSTVEASVSRGKKILKIDRRWRSEVCDKLWEGFAQTT